MFLDFKTFKCFIWLDSGYESTCRLISTQRGAKHLSTEFVKNLQDCHCCNCTIRKRQWMFCQCDLIFSANTPHNLISLFFSSNRGYLIFYFVPSFLLATNASQRDCQSLNDHGVDQWSLTYGCFSFQFFYSFNLTNLFLWLICSFVSETGT